MKKLCLTLVGIYILFFASFGQQYNTDTVEYKNTQLSLEEVNLVSGYYQQDGNHSAVTGGIGTQKLHDFSNVLELKFVKWNENDNKYSFSLEAGLDNHTAASQKFISKTGASSPYGVRFYPSFNWKVENSNKTTLGFGASYSTEFNYHSYGINFVAGKISKNNNREINFKAQAFFDRVTLIEPSEFVQKIDVSTNTSASRSGRGSKNTIPKSPRNTYSGSVTVSQVVSKNFQVALIADVVAQKGLLSLPFHRVYFNYPSQDSAKIENLPDNRLKLPLGVRMNYFMGDKVIFRSYYRYYIDNWGVQSQTASIEIPYKISPFLSVSPFYRYYVQTAATYFAPYKEHTLDEKYYTSNYDLSAFSSQYYGVNVRITPKKGVFKIPFFNMIELRYGHYVQTTSLQADNIGINFRFK
jgi:hypothetical protein